MMNKNINLIVFALCLIFTIFSLSVHAQVIDATKGSAKGTLIQQTYRPLRYQPLGTDFVIENGLEFFNRPLYGGNTAFRVDDGDKPEFIVYLPGRGGNLRFGIKTARGTKWLQDANKIVTRYRPGSMIYEIRDSLLDEDVLRLTVVESTGRAS